MTKQEYYNLLVKSARDSTFPGFDVDKHQCRYRFGNHRCAVGIIIPDEDYDPLYDNRPGGSLCIHELPSELKLRILPEEMTLEQLSEVQTKHDAFACTGWDSCSFIKGINTLYFFQDITQENPYAITTSTQAPDTVGA